MGLGSPFGGLGSPSSIFDANRGGTILYFGSNFGAILVKNPEKTRIEQIMNKSMPKKYGK